MTTQTRRAIEEIKVTLPELLASLAPGDEVILTRTHQPVAKLVSEKPPERKPRVPGLGKGMISIIADDEDHLKDRRPAVSNRRSENHYRLRDADAPRVFLPRIARRGSSYLRTLVTRITFSVRP
jgi:antitoxin (DNA-binding transcriptional repressor) of toxin-antitoxin stability system